MITITCKTLRDACHPDDQSGLTILLDLMDKDREGHQEELDGGLFYAVVDDMHESVKKLLEYGANPTAGLSAAAERGRMEIVETLVEAGADTSHQLSHPIYIAAARGHEDVVRYLYDKTPDLDQVIDNLRKGYPGLRGYLQERRSAEIESAALQEQTAKVIAVSSMASDGSGTDTSPQFDTAAPVVMRARMRL